MTTGTATIANEHLQLLDELEGLLTGQIELAHQGDAAGERFGLLAAQAGSVVEEITQLGPPDEVEYQTKFERLRELYETLSLILVAEKADVCEELTRVRKGRKIIETYRGTERKMAGNSGEAILSHTFTETHVGKHY